MSKRRLINVLDCRAETKRDFIGRNAGGGETLLATLGVTADRARRGCNAQNRLWFVVSSAGILRVAQDDMAVGGLDGWGATCCATTRARSVQTEGKMPP